MFDDRGEPQCTGMPPHDGDAPATRSRIGDFQDDERH